jgi:hypothetical protein
MSKTAAKRPAVATKKRRRKMAAAPAKRRSTRRKMSGAKEDTKFLGDALQGAAGALLAGYMPKLVQQVIKPKEPINPHLINAGSAVVGFGLYKLAKLRAVGAGMVIGAAANSGAAIINSIPGMGSSHTKRRTDVPANVRKEIDGAVQTAMRRIGADPAVLAGMDPGVLTGEPGVLTGYAFERNGI